MTFSVARCRSQTAVIMQSALGASAGRCRDLPINGDGEQQPPWPWPQEPSPHSLQSVLCCEKLLEFGTRMHLRQK